ncbi:MAG TPA: hypothetical protein VLF69_03405 [Candidatus Saccharimonadales bacterium]|nr:hypothetical protein [Candidatus Saccharimonadales bacterium]
MKKKTLHRHLHPIHWHGSMFLAIAAILLTSFKSSGEMLRALHAVPVQAGVMDSVYMRDAETGHSPIILNIGARHTTFSGK